MEVSTYVGAVRWHGFLLQSPRRLHIIFFDINGSYREGKNIINSINKNLRFVNFPENSHRDLSGAKLMPEREGESKEQKKKEKATRVRIRVRNKVAYLHEEIRRTADCKLHRKSWGVI